MKAGDKEKELHPAIAPSQDNRSHGKDVGLIDPPIVSVNPVSDPANVKPKKEFKTFNNVYVIDKTKMMDNEFDDLEVNGSFFVAADEVRSTDKLMDEYYKQVAHIRAMWGEVERDENGDEIWDQVIVKERKRNSDGTLQLSGDGKIITGANHTIVPRLIFVRNWIVKPVVKDQEIGDGSKAPADGVLVIRVT